MTKDKSTKPAALLHEARKQREDRAALNRTIFNALTIEATQPETVVLLLNSAEEPVILDALHHLDRFAEKWSENYLILYNNKILDNIYRHSRHPHLFIRRFALKILSQMFSLPEIKRQLLNNLECFNIALETFQQVYRLWYFALQCL